MLEPIEKKIILVSPEEPRADLTNDFTVSTVWITQEEIDKITIDISKTT